MNKKSDAQQTNKADEIRALSDFQAAQANGSYLSMFLTDELVAWVAARIREDGNPDIMAQLDSEIDRTNKSGNAAEALRLEVERLNKIVKNYEEKHMVAVKEANEENRDLRAKYEAAHKALAELTEQFNERRAEHAAEVNEWKDDYAACNTCLHKAEQDILRQQEENRKLRIEVEFQATTITQLKAKLYDLREELELATK